VSKPSQSTRRTYHLTAQDVKAAVKASEESLAQQDIAAERARDTTKRAEITRRRQLLRDLETQYQDLYVMEKSMFFSFSSSAKPYVTVAREKADKIGFQFRSGFDDEVLVSPMLNHGIMKQIRRSFCFLGIWVPEFTAEMTGTQDTRGVGGIPSVWLPFELGVAAEANRPFKLLIKEGIHQEYFRKPYGDKPHLIFNDTNFPQKIELALQELHGRFEEMYAAALAG
jgi:hypothetical protein